MNMANDLGLSLGLVEGLHGNLHLGSACFLKISTIMASSVSYISHGLAFPSPEAATKKHELKWI